MDSVEVVIVGNIAFDVNTFLERNDGKDITVTNKGGACLYSAIPASILTKVGIVARTGYDFDWEELEEFNIDKRGLKIIKNSKTTKFHHTYLSKDGKQRTFKPEVYEKTITKPSDIPASYYKAKYFHISTNFPDIQEKFIEKIRKNSNALISIDTHEAYMEKESEKIKELFDKVDIAFIDENYKELLDCKAPIKIIKMGKKGCKYIDENREFTIKAKVIENVIDKTGAGDVVTGVYLASRSKNLDEPTSLKLAVDMATASITDYGVEHLKNHNLIYKKEE